MHPKSRAALISRVANVVGSDKPIPQTFAELTTSEQLMLENADPEAAAVLRGVMLPELEQQVLLGTLSTSYGGQTAEQEQAAARQQYLATAEQRMAADLEALAQPNAQAAQLREQARQESLLIAQAQQQAAARATYGVRG